ncbi:MAG: helix-turn-helix domain-containing protein [Chloroflexi bacterium]|nr:helix-turn-helix domain-containing protein [Chloroflexota bacterium]
MPERAQQAGSELPETVAGSERAQQAGSELPETVAVSTFGHAPTNGAPTVIPSPSSLRRAILVNLRQRGPMSPDALATHLGASRTGVLQQLHALEEGGLVSHQLERHGVGRPRHRYDVTPDAQDLFPMDYDGFALGLIEAISAVGGEELLDEVLAARRRQLGNRIRERLVERLAADAPLADRVRELAVVQDAAGYLAEAIIGPDGTIRIREHNCAIYHVSREVNLCCEAELALFRYVCGTNVERETHIAAGDRSCTFRFGQPTNRPD